MKIHNIIGYNKPNYTGPVMGVEIELEGRNIPEAKDVSRAFPLWKVVTDGSLRGESCEFVLTEPIPSGAAKAAITLLHDFLVKKGTVCQFSNRTSVHVHLNVADIELQVLGNIIYIYYLFEDVLLNYCGTDRHDNRFCLSIRRAEGILQELRRKLNQRGLTGFRQENYKYAALNLAPIVTQGSIEFRGMRGTLDSEILSPWLSVIENIYTAAFEFKNPQEIFNKVNGVGIQFLLKKVFKEHLDAFSFNGFENEILYNLSICAEMPEMLTFKEEKVAVKKEEEERPIPAPINWEVAPHHRAVRDNRGHIDPAALDMIHRDRIINRPRGGIEALVGNFDIRRNPAQRADLEAVIEERDMLREQFAMPHPALANDF